MAVYNYRPCTIPGCDRKHKAKGLCSLHYTRQQERARKEELADLRREVERLRWKLASKE